MADTRARRFFGNSRVSPSGDARYTEEYSSQCIAVHLSHSPWPVEKLANQIRARPSLSGDEKGSNLFAAARIVAAHGKKLAGTWNAYPVKYDDINISREEVDA